MNLVSQLAPFLMQYSDIDPNFIKINITNVDKITNIKITSDKDEIGKALTELLTLMVKLTEANGKTKVSIEVN